ncbi:UNVERIFIED_CONTAM: hypothetical protein FKN15_071560, partial [Acipenser sinensis]
INNVGTSPAQQCRALHTSQWRRGLEEFFDETPNWGEPTVKSGAPWTAKQLRTKSSEDLHKLWYRFKEYPIPWYLNRRYKRKRFFTPIFVDSFIRLRIESHLHSKILKKKADLENKRKLQEKFSKLSART